MDKKDEMEGSTPLHWAVRNGHLEVALMLARAGAPTRKADGNGATPLRLADFQSNMHRALLRGQNDAHRMKGDKSRGTANGPLSEHIARRDNETLNSLFARAEDDLRSSPLGRLFSDCVHDYKMHPGLLAGTGASMSKSKQFECMRIMIADGDSEGLSFFQKIGCDLRTKDAGGNTLLHYAAQYGRPKAMSLLVAEGAARDFVNEQNNRGQTPLDIAHAANHIDTSTKKILYGAGGRFVASLR